MPASDVGPALEIWPYPLPSAARTALVALLRTEWSRTDYDWAEAMTGALGQDLAITTIVARLAGDPVATATVHYSRRHPEVAVLGNVLTHPSHRGRGLAGEVVEAAVAQAEAAGCVACLLGSATKPRNVYLRHGFTWLAGVVMCRPFNDPEFASACFAAGQPALVRGVTWGDLPGITLLASQPLASTYLDYPRGLVSPKFAPPKRCLSTFPAIWYDTAARGGLFAVAASPQTGRIFGFGTVTQPADADVSQLATIELVAHDAFAGQLRPLLEFLLSSARVFEIRAVRAVAARADQAKLSAYHAQGFIEVGRHAAPAPLDLDVVELRREIE